MVKVNFPKRFYVYIHRRKSDNEIFYVGKGTKNRAWVLRHENIWWKRVYDKHGRTIHIVKDDMSEECAYSYERVLIYKLRQQGKILCNVSDGGGFGPSGVDAWNKKTVHCSNGMTFASGMEAAEWVRNNTRFKSAACGNISSACVGKMHSIYGFSWWYDGQDEKEYISPNISLSIARGTVIHCSNGMSFPYLKEALKWLRENGFPHASDGNIYSALNGHTRGCYGLAWWKDGDKAKKFIPFNPSLDAPDKKRIRRSDGIIYESLRKAGEAIQKEKNLKSNPFSNISACALGKVKSSYGYKWKYIDEGN